MTSQELQIIFASEALSIDSNVDFKGLRTDYLDLEWYELNTAKLKRKTQDGHEVQIKKRSNHVYRDKDIIYLDSEKVVQVRLKSCDCILISSQRLNEVGEVAFVIGNQHLPIFLSEENEMLVAYDGSLYEMLLSLGFPLKIENRFLHPQQMLRAFGNFNQ